MSATSSQEKSPGPGLGGRDGPSERQQPAQVCGDEGSLPSWAVSAVRRVPAIVIRTFGWEVGEGKCPGELVGLGDRGQAEARWGPPCGRLGQGVDVEGDSGRAGGERGQGVDLASGLEVGQVGAVAAQGVAGLAGPSVLAGLVLEQSRCQRRLGKTREAGGER
jgi:hypothetical protein